MSAEERVLGREEGVEVSWTAGAAWGLLCRLPRT